MITVRQIMMNVNKGESVSGYRNLLLQKYVNYWRTTNKKIITASKELPYPNNYQDPYFVLHYKILSDSIKNVWYDIVIQFITDNRVVPETQIRVFSNSPQFMYTYAYCYNKDKDLLFPNLYPKIVLSDYPKEKNPKCMKGMDKHVFVALKETISKRITYQKIDSMKKDKWTIIDNVEIFNNNLQKKIKGSK